MKPFELMNDDEKRSVVFQAILEAVVAEANEEWYKRYHEAKSSTTDRTDLMRIDIAFADMIHILRKMKVLVAPAADIQIEASKIAKKAPEYWFGEATQHGHKLIAKQPIAIVIKAYATAQDREKKVEPLDQATVITVEDFDEVVATFSAPARYLSFTSKKGVELKTRDAARYLIQSQSKK